MLLNVRMVNEKFSLLTLWRDIKEVYCEKKILRKLVRSTYNLLDLHELKVVGFPHHLKERSNFY